jgi:sugar lactone lactonase YvrE
MSSGKRSVLAVVVLGFLAACAGKDGANGLDGKSGAAGASGANGEAGAQGAPGAPGAPAAGGDAGSTAPSGFELLALPGTTWFPESLTAAKNGAVFVGSLGGLGIARFDAATDVATRFVAPGVVKNVAGVLADDANGLLYACDNDLGASPYQATLRAFDLATGAAKASYPFPAAGFCNDMAFDNAGNLFVTDSFGKIQRLKKGATALDTWLTNTLLAPTAASGFGADGIAFDGTSSFYVNAFSDSRLLRVPVNGDGTAGTPVSITTTPALVNPDGMRALDATTVLVVEGGRLSRVAVTGTTGAATTLVSRLDTPTSVAISGAHYFVSEGQLPVFLGAVKGPPALPFLVRRFPIAAP